MMVVAVNSIGPGSCSISLNDGGGLQIDGGKVPGSSSGNLGGPEVCVWLTAQRDWPAWMSRKMLWEAEASIRASMDALAIG